MAGAAAEAEPAGGGESGGGEGGGGEGIAKVVDKVVEIGEKVVVALANHSKITNSDKTLSVLPDKVQPNQVRNGALGSVAFSLVLKDIVGISLTDLRIEIDYMLCTVFKNKGKFLKDIRMVVTGDVFPGVTVDVQTAYGSPGNTGPSPEEWIVDLTIDIDIHWNSAFLFDGKSAAKLRLNADSGAKAV